MAPDILPQEQWSELWKQVCILEGDIGSLADTTAQNYSTLKETVTSFAEKFRNFESTVQTFRKQSKETKPVQRFHQFIQHDAGCVMTYAKSYLDLASNALQQTIRELLKEDQALGKADEELGKEFYENIEAKLNSYLDSNGESVPADLINLVQEAMKAKHNVYDDDDYIREILEELHELAQKLPDNKRCIVEEFLNGRVLPNREISAREHEELCEGVEQFCLDAQGVISDRLFALMQKKRMSINILLYLREEVFGGHVREINELVQRASPYARRTISTVQALQYWADPENMQLRIISVSDELFSPMRRAMLNNAFGPNGEISFDIAPQLKAAVHPGLDMSLLHKCVNAKRHGKADGIEIKAYEEMDTVVVEVLDNGKGIEPEIIEHIFDDGFSGEGSSGIGLALVDKRLEAMGGSIECKGHGGIEGGAKFILRLPAAEQHV